MYVVIILVCYISSIKTDSVKKDVPESREKYRKLFEFFKSKYDKKYMTKDEEQIAFLNFIDNSKKVEYLNEHNKNPTYYVLDRYGDIDTEYMEEHYAVTVNPIASQPLRNLNADMESEIKRTKQEKVLEKTELFDLDNAEELFERHMRQYGKEIPENKYKRQQHYLRFVKSLVNLNRNHVNGDGEVDLDENADVVQEPDKFAY